jgi:phage terminase large subunit-like protein
VALVDTSTWKFPSEQPLPDSPSDPLWTEILREISNADDGGLADFRYWCTQSFWFFNRYCLSFGQLLCAEPDNPHFGKPWPDHPWIFARCNELQKDPDNQFHQWPRNSFKSALITQNLTMWEWIRDADVGSKMDPPVEGTALRTLILTYKRDKTGEAFLAMVKREVESNELLRLHWPDLFYVDPKQSGEWGAGGLRIKQRGNPRESTLSVAGLDAMPTSQHYDRIIFDDPVVRETVRTPEMIQSTVEAMKQATFLRSDDTRVRYVGTRWKIGDPWEHWTRQGLFASNHHSCYDKNGEPTLRSRKHLDEFKKAAGKYEFSAQMLGNCIADDEKRFEPNWMRYYERDPDEERINKNVYIFVDPARSQKKSSDYTVIWVIGLGPDRNYYCLDLYRERLAVPDFLNLLFDLVTIWRPLKVYEEVFGAQRDVEHIRERQKLLGFRFDIDTLPEVRTPKEERIEALMVPMADGRFWFPKGGYGHTAKGDHRDVLTVFKEDEYEYWTPAGTTMHDDMLDCLAFPILDKMRNQLRWPIRKVSDSYDRGRKLGRRAGSGRGGGERTAWSW